MILIPLTNEPSQQFDIELEDRVITFWMYYNSRDECYLLDLLEDEITLIQGVKVLTLLDLLNGLFILDGDLLVYSELFTTAKVGDFDNTHNMYYLTPDELDEIGIREYGPSI